MIFIYFVGTAGSGKTTLTAGFKYWLNLQGLDCITINLDPGVEHLPYSCDVDIRDWIRLDDVMLQYNLGPNGAQIVAADLIAVHIKDVKNVIEEFKTDYALVDTPGQVELFTLRESSRYIIDMLGRNNSVIIFLLDPLVAKTPSGFISLLLLAASVSFRFDLPMMLVLSKMDILKKEEVEKIVKWSEDLDLLYEDLIKEKGMNARFSEDLFKVLKEEGIYKKIYPVSANLNYGMEDIYNFIQQVFFGGEEIYY